MEKIKIEDAVKLIKQTNGEIFSVTFTKKDGTLRDMVCKLGVKKHLKGGEQAYDPTEYDLLCVFDMQKVAYRSISFDTLSRVKVGGIEFEVIQ